MSKPLLSCSSLSQNSERVDVDVILVFCIIAMSVGDRIVGMFVAL